MSSASSQLSPALRFPCHVHVDRHVEAFPARYLTGAAAPQPITALSTIENRRASQSISASTP